MSRKNIQSILIALAFIPVFAFAKDGYEISIKIKGFKNQKLLLGNYFGDKQYLKDSAITDALGKVVFKGKEKLQGGIYLIATADKRLLFDFVVTEQVFALETDSADFQSNMKAIGSPENEVFFAYSKFTTKMAIDATALEKKMLAAKAAKDTANERKYKFELLSYDKRVQDYRKEVIKTHPTFLMAKLFRIMEEVEVPPAPVLPNGKKDSMFQYNYYREHYFDNFDFTDDRVVYTPVFHPKVESFITKFTLQIPDSINSAADFVVAKSMPSKEISKYVINWISNHYETSEYMGMDAVFVHMALTYYNKKEIAYWIDETTRFKIVDRAQTLEYNLLGKKGQNLNMPDTGEVYQSLYNIKANYTVLLFWDANCGRCKEEVPKILDLYKEQNSTINIKGTKKIEVFAVGMTPEAKDWKKYIRENKLPWINVHDPNHESNFRKFYDVYSTPVIYLLDENKQIIAKRLSADQLKDFIEKGLK
jgi:thiol-disulfide isomerase/thioredoxin